MSRVPSEILGGPGSELLWEHHLLGRTNMSPQLFHAPMPHPLSAAADLPLQQQSHCFMSRCWFEHALRGKLTLRRQHPLLCGGELIISGVQTSTTPRLVLWLMVSPATPVHTAANHVERST